MRKILAFICLVFMLNLAPVLSLGESGKKHGYDYVKHAERSYERAKERYQSNPTQQNRQIMEMRKKTYERRKKKFGQ